MPITYQIDPERNLVTFEAHGILKVPEYQEIRTRLVSDPLFRPGMKQLADFRSVEQHAFTTEGYNHYKDQEILLQPIFGEGRYAIVTNSDLHFGLTRKLFAEMDESHQDSQVFRSIEEAKAWLFSEDEPE